MLAGDDGALPDDGIGTSDDETNSNSSTNSSTEQESTSPNMAQSRRVIKLDLAAMSQLLTFDEVRIGNSSSGRNASCFFLKPKIHME